MILFVFNLNLVVAVKSTLWPIGYKENTKTSRLVVVVVSRRKFPLDTEII